VNSFASVLIKLILSLLSIFGIYILISIVLYLFSELLLSFTYNTPFAAQTQENIASIIIGLLILVGVISWLMGCFLALRKIWDIKAWYQRNNKKAESIK